jgi:glutamate racemase
VTFVDPAPAIARRVVDLSGPKAADPPGSPARVVFTSNRSPSADLAAALARFGLGG